MIFASHNSRRFHPSLIPGVAERLMLAFLARGILRTFSTAVFSFDIERHVILAGHYRPFNRRIGRF